SPGVRDSSDHARVFRLLRSHRGRRDGEFEKDYANTKTALRGKATPVGPIRFAHLKRKVGTCCGSEPADIFANLLQSRPFRAESALGIFRQQGSRSTMFRSRPQDGLNKTGARSEEHTSELQSLRHLVCRLLLEKKKRKHNEPAH